ncbi:Reverse transcriptase (RNA-dependent DNA polymerase) [Popillia japonica]|uniref:Reverse transcriptase (RNA-dependent DNA polymerase) n=2 Tax=Popillia japonica TaxID=7064 RepID=A0AAW1LQ00_POPJA
MHNRKKTLCNKGGRSKKYIVRGNSRSFLRSYSQNRERVCYNGELSAVKIVNKEVPQGSVLGPILFIICINVIGNSDNTANCKHFRCFEVKCFPYSW